MFTKYISVNETIESHLNTSSDENGEDDSYDESGKDEFDTQSIDEIKSKITRYKYYMTKLKNKRKDLLSDKSISLWQAVYFTFFGDYNNGAVTLHELNLRCKFLFNMDKVYGFEKEIEKKKESVSYWMDCYTKARTECDTLKEEIAAIATLAAKLAK